MVNMKNHQGFTLIELIVVIILLGILSVTVLPKFISSKGFEEYTYRNELLTKLRAIQLRAMQQTDGSQCHLVLVTEKKAGLPVNDCDATPTFDDNEPETLIIAIDSSHSVDFNISSGNLSFSFDQMGRPLGCSTNPCKITIIGESTLDVEINSEGYIYVP